MQFDDVRTTQISNDTCPHRGFDMLIVYLPEGLHVPLVSPSAIPLLNKHKNNHI